MALEVTPRGGWLGQSPRGFLHPLGQNLRPVYELLLPNQGWVTFLLLYGVTLSVAWSVMSADWTNLPYLPSAVLAGLVAGLILARVPLHGLILQVVALVIGSLTVLWFAMQSVDAGTWSNQAREVGERLWLWFHAATANGISTDSLPFATALLAALWLLGYLCAWFAFRHRNIWVPLVVAGIGILTNLSYLPSSHWPYFLLFLVFAMLALAWMSILTRRRAWSQHRIQHPPLLRLFGMSDALLLTLVVVTVAVILPTSVPRPSLLQRGYEYLRWPVEEFRGDFNRLFAGIPARKPHRFRTFDTTLPFQGTISLGDEVVFILMSTQPSYWRVRSYPTYTSQGWISGATQIVPADWRPAVAAPLTYQKRELTVQQVELNFSPRLLMAAGIAQGSDINLEVEIPTPPTHTIHLDTPVFDAPLPADIQSFAGTIRRLAEARARADSLMRMTLERETIRVDFNDTGGPPATVDLTRLVSLLLSEEDVRALLPDDLELIGVEANEAGALVRVMVRRPVPVPLDILSIRSQKRLFSSNRYMVASSVSVATPQELREARTEYPGWVRDTYLQLPNTLPQRVVELAQTLTAKAETPYDKALAIRDYLHTLPYSLNIPPPAYNADGVDHFLFEARAGYSDYFASAMTAMLRAVGVPARMTVGYGFGEVDERGNVVVRDRNSHGWVEVFFPNYGWVEFEPTPGREGPYAEDAVEELPLGGEGAGDEFVDEDDFPWELGFTRPTQPADQGIGLLEIVWMTLGVGVMGLGFLSVLGFRWLLGSPATAAGVYGKMARLSGVAGLGPFDGQTPWEYGRNLARRLPRIAPEVAAVVGTYAKGRYGNQALSEPERTRVLEAWRAIRRTLFLHALRRRRW